MLWLSVHTIDASVILLMVNRCRILVLGGGGAGGGAGPDPQVVVIALSSLLKACNTAVVMTNGKKKEKYFTDAVWVVVEVVETL